MLYGKCAHCGACFGHAFFKKFGVGRNESGGHFTPCAFFRFLGSKTSTMQHQAQDLRQARLGLVGAVVLLLVFPDVCSGFVWTPPPAMRTTHRTSASLLPGWRVPARRRAPAMPLLMAETNSSAGAESKAPAKRIGTLLAQSEDLQKAEDELNLASVEVELKDINRKMMATLRRRRKLMKEFKDLSGGKDRDDFQRPLTSYCTAEEYDMEHAFRRMRVWSRSVSLRACYAMPVSDTVCGAVRGKAKYVEDSTVIHVRTASRFDEDEEEEEDPEGEGDVFIFPYGVVVCWGMTEEQQVA